MKGHKLYIVIICVCLIIPSLAFPFDLDMIRSGKLADSEMEQFRGRYKELFFKVEFSGRWSPDGAGADLVYDGDLSSAKESDTGLTPDDSGVTSGVGSVGEEVNIMAYVGNLDGANGVFQLSLVPGNNNTVSNIMNIYFTVINAQDQAQAAEISKLFLPGN